MIKSTKSRASVIKELFGFLWKRKMWWLIPLVVVLIVFLGLLSLAAATGPLQPFIYTLF